MEKEIISLSWRYNTGAQVWSVAITSDGRYIFAGSDYGIHCFDEKGNLQWQQEVEGQAFRIVLADEIQQILVGCNGGNNAYLIDYNGNILQEYSTDGNTWEVGITRDGEKKVVGSFDNYLYSFDRNGNLQWKQEVGDRIRRVSLTTDGEYIVLGADDGYIYCFDNKGMLRWQYKTGADVWAGAEIAHEGKFIIAGSNDNHVYFFDLDGNLKWKHSLDKNVNIVAITPDGQYCAAAGTDDTVYLFDQTGKVLWHYRTKNDIYALALSKDGRFLMVGSDDHHVYHFDGDTQQISEWCFGDKIYGVTMNPDGKVLAAASCDHHVYAFVRTKFDKAADLKRRTQIIINRIRTDAINNPHLAIVRWFDEFDRALRFGNYAGCQFLLEEMEKGGYSLSEQENAYVESRKAALLLCQGILCHKNGDYMVARQYYEQSKAIQHHLGHRDGEGQVIAALYALEKDEKQA